MNKLKKILTYDFSLFETDADYFAAFVLVNLFAGFFSMFFLEDSYTVFFFALSLFSLIVSALYFSVWITVSTIKMISKGFIYSLTIANQYLQR